MTQTLSRPTRERNLLQCELSNNVKLLYSLEINLIIRRSRKIFVRLMLTGSDFSESHTFALASEERKDRVLKLNINRLINFFYITHESLTVNLIIESLSLVFITVGKVKYN